MEEEEEKNDNKNSNILSPKHPKNDMTMVRTLTQSRNKAAAVNKRVLRNTAK